ncbi:DeoR/GlpR family DNA-binding transcription regulator [Sneathiella marina]|uniref:DeoR/GlpR family DNA-binding transcription regulator n=1 Tax=Sneathiella marina TaxID=2950108 RepID=A0ABY4W7K6_9PROT|nr:DeoR/GlpR family DNA-binding transcription regulator [Sneathiella marina]USG63007.1 DeoR/GlpR family DNA-binding transcription regulator [Sneathiella marina]
MKQTKRQMDIMRLLQIEKSCGVIELATKLGVSDETIRRDIKQMTQTGSVEKIHGGVMLPHSSLEPPFLRRLEEQRQEKQKIAKLAASIIGDGETLLIDNGSTSCYIAKELSAHRNMTIVTNSTEVARDLCARNNNTVYMAGGELRADDSAAYGPTAVSFAKQFSTERAILSIGALHGELGCFDFDLSEAEFKRAVIPQASSIVMVADHTKFNRPGVVKVCDFTRVDMLLTDQLPPQEIVDQIGRNHIHIA